MDRKENIIIKQPKAWESREKKTFKDYLGSCPRFLMNRRIKKIKYHG